MKLHVGVASLKVQKSSLSSRFTLLEIIIAVAIFALGISLMLDRRNQSLEDSHYAKQLLEVQLIIDDIIADYRLHPFSEEPRPLAKDYAPFEVNVQVTPENINIIPEEWRIDEALLEGSEESKKKKRTILRVSVDVQFKSLDEATVHKVNTSTLIRLIELEDPNNPTKPATEATAKP